MEWSKYVLSVMVGGCLLVLYGKKGTGRNKWLFGAGTGTSLIAMELAVEYMLNKAAWEMALSIMKGGAIFSVIVLLGYVRESGSEVGETCRRRRNCCIRSGSG